MNKPFVPWSAAEFLAAAASTAASRPGVALEASAAKTFRPLQLTAAAAAAPPTHGEPQVSLQREGDRVTHIRIQCPCGQTLELACAY